MKNLLFSFFILLNLSLTNPSPPVRLFECEPQPNGNLIIITIDGFRWQELFNGADPQLISNTECTADTALMKMQYWSPDPTIRRQRLMPFFWSVLSQRGQLFGNREYQNYVNTANVYAVSYPGYHEMFTGNTDLLVSSNKKNLNRHTNVLEYLNKQPGFEKKVVAFTSWDVFPFILNKDRADLNINSGYDRLMGDSLSLQEKMLNRVQEEAIQEKTGTRYDQLTFMAATEYLRQHRPRVLFLGLGETDEYAHKGRYDLYLQQANRIDRMIAELWYWAQATPGYKDNTSFIITTDHGRGSRDSKWTSHSAFIKGSSQTWMAMIGPGIESLGEIKDPQQHYQKQVASTIAGLLGEKFGEAAMISRR